MTELILRLWIVPALSFWLTFLAAYAEAQVQNATHTKADAQASGEAARPGQPARPEVHELSADGLAGTITVLRTGHPFPVGGSAFAQIRISNKSKSKFTDAELALRADTASILNVSGGRLEVRQEGEERVARLKRIRKGRPRTVIIELKLQDPSTPDQNAPENRLHVTLRVPGGAGDTATLDWEITNCAGEFYSEIVKVREGSGSGISDKLKAVKSRDKSRPGRWLFPPRLKRSRATRKCIRRARRWSYQRGRYVYRCVRYKRIEPVVVADATPVKFERSVFNFAGTFVRSRTMDGALDRRRDTGWATHRVSQNLKGFLQQDSSPAICTGAIQFFNYFDDRMTGFVKRAAKLDDMDSKAQRLASLRTDDAIRAAETAAAEKAEPGGHPGWGTTPLDLPQAQEKAELKRQIQNLAQITGDAQLGQSVADADNAYAALKVMSAYYKSDAGKALNKPTRAALYQALSAIEAADYIGKVAMRYADLHQALIGSMETLRHAHGRSCQCGG
ncbi:MAG: hypothetical protein MPJ78_08365 [Hyphomicrobiaceae bacterium]|nr:hypothetical protein [Hyphomicrobiaceae bacterium]